MQLDFKKKLGSLEVIVNNQLKMRSEESFANYFDMNENMNFSIIGKGRNTDESVIHEFGLLEGLMSSEKRMTNVNNINNNKQLTPVNEIQETRSKPSETPFIPQKVSTGNESQKFNELTGNSFFNDVSLPHTLGNTSPIITKTQNTNNFGDNQNTLSSETKKNQKIKREHVTNDLNCTLNDASVLEYVVDENGYLIDQHGNAVYDDDGKVVKLTEDQINNFKDNDMYEEIEG